MRFLSLVGNSFGCSASGERLLSAARDGDLQEAKALLDYNPRLARYSTFGVRNSPLHYSAAQGHHEIVSLLVESGVDINLRNYRGQTALMQACQHGHWEVVLILILFGANTSQATPGSVPCPLYRYGIVSFTKLPHTIPTTTSTSSSRTSISLSLCTCSSSDVLDTGALLTDPHYNCKPVVSRAGSQSVGSSSFRSLSCRFPPSLCRGGSDVDEPQSRLMNVSYSRTGLRSRLSTSEVEGKRSWFCALNHSVATGGSPCYNFSFFLSAFSFLIFVPIFLGEKNVLIGSVNGVVIIHFVIIENVINIINLALPFTLKWCI
ncbi:hypothetical protein N665_0708s0016 [Sinapis alba]|nr:hypothetical protein N665_0708s0016 [Sinapis alba]